MLHSNHTFICLAKGDWSLPLPTGNTKLNVTGFLVKYAKRPKRGPGVLNQSPILSGCVPIESETKLVHGYFAENSIMELQMKLRWPSTNSSWSLNGVVSAKSKSLSRHLRHLRFRQHVDIAARVTRQWPTGSMI